MTASPLERADPTVQAIASNSAMIVIAVLLVEVFVTLLDFVEEDMSRKLPASERINRSTLETAMMSMRPGKPTDNAFIEAFNGRFRSECLNAHWFMTLDDARSKLEDWRRYYNERRPHGAIGQDPLTCP